ncbi:MAG: nicotinate (nicotinamide) nucleotide adenylyltransferase [Faecalicoccus sp.]|nr:nicotinate (nicotinamide) nucleotide adenylyltransferase [Faecalicoccus sp.]
MNIAILGGSFDPIHYGHIAIGRTALEKLPVDEVWYMLTKSTPLKDRSLTEDTHRLRMLELALEKEPNLKPCTIELEREGKSFTIDTLSILKERYPEHDFWWIIGNDQLEQFDKWKGADKLVTMAHFVCVDRDGKFGSSKYDIQKIHMTPMPVSSSQIRNGDRLNYVPSPVMEYIYANRLYITDFVRTRVKEKRYLHSLSVADLCEKLAASNGLDTQKAYLIGLFHDIAKSMDKEHMQPWMEIICPENMKYDLPVWHGFVGSEIVDRIFYLHDPVIKNAIYHHVLGTGTDPYSMIVFCADKLDPLRGYDSKPLIDACMNDIYKGFEAVKKANDQYLEGKLEWNSKKLY